MAGMGSRLRPHTLTIPKPLVPVGGKPIVHRLVEDIVGTATEKIEEIAFVIGDFGPQVEAELIKMAESMGAKGSVFHQKEPLGTAHAVLCAAECLNGPVVVAFADTLFKADFKLDTTADGIIWVKQIDNPSAFGVVKLDDDNHITDFIEKPKDFVSDLAMIGIYYFKSGEALKTELQYLIDNDVIKGGEYQLPDALKNLTKKGAKFKTGEVSEWLDCGNPVVTIHTNQRVLEFDKDKKLVADNVELINATIIPPCFVGENVKIENAIVGPHVSLGSGTVVTNAIIKNTIVQKNAIISNTILSDSMIGNYAKILSQPKSISIGDYTTIE